MKRENGYDILLEDALHSSDNAMRTSKISCPRYPVRAEATIIGRASHRISSYSHSVRRGGRYSVKRYSYSMAVRTAAMPIVDRGGSRELADQ
jgi:hypothetical protein